MADHTEQFRKLKDMLLTRSRDKQDVYAVTRDVFDEMKGILTQVAQDLFDVVHPVDERIQVSLDSEGDFEIKMTLAGDTVVFHMHTNVFTFPPHHMVHKSPYVKDHPSNAYCGIINIYNFLTDSFRYQRSNDSGYLIGRIFVNKDRHFFVEGQEQLGIRFNDFSTATLGKEEMHEILCTALNYVLDFELYTPPYQSVKVVSLSDIQQLSQNLKLQTAKRLGFRFQADDENSVEF
jgi:hypothetical protein